jgi:hypothetical protein
VRVVTGLTLVGRRSVDDLGPSRGGVVVTGDTQFSRAGRQQLRLVRLVTHVTVRTLLGREVSIALGQRLADVVVTAGAQFELCGHQQGLMVRGMRRVAGQAVSVNGRWMRTGGVPRWSFVAIHARLGTAGRFGGGLARLVTGRAIQFWVDRSLQQSLVGRRVRGVAAHAVGPLDGQSVMGRSVAALGVVTRGAQFGLRLVEQGRVRARVWIVASTASIGDRSVLNLLIEARVGVAVPAEFGLRRR